MPSGVGTRVAAVLTAQALVLGTLLTIALDQYAHKRVETLGGVNSWGYRGRVLHARKPGEIRLAYLGGSQAFGWGVAAEETTAGYLRYAIENSLARRQYEGPITVANIAALGLDAEAYAPRLSQFRYLQPDLVCLHLDLARPAAGPVMPPRSAIAALTGYTPMLPTVLEEKGQIGIARAGVLLRRIDGWIYDAVTDPPSSSEQTSAVLAALDLALARAGRVLVIVPAPLTANESAEHARLISALQPRVASDARVRLVDLSTHPELSSPALRLDGVNLSAGGHSTEAQAILSAALDLLQVPDRSAQ